MCRIVMGRRGWVGVAVALAMTLGACSDGDPIVGVTLDTVSEMDGDWGWMQSVGGIAGVTLTPDSEGFTLNMRFEFTSERRGTVRVFRDGEFETSTTFTLREFDFGGTRAVRIRYAEPVLGAESHRIRSLGFEGSQLILAEEISDGFDWWWGRPLTGS